MLQLCPDRLRAARLTSAHVAMLVRRGAHCEVVAWPVPEDPPLVLVVAAQEKKAHALCDSVAAVCLRGMARITAAAVVRLDDSWVVETRGTDLANAMMLKGVDASRTTSRSVRDTARVLGIEAAALCCYRECLRLLGEKCSVDLRHIQLMADFQCYTGEPLAFDRHGMTSAGDDIMGRAMFETPIKTLAKASFSNAVDELSSVLGQLVMGRKPRSGTGAADVVMDLWSACCDDEDSDSV